MRVFYPWSYLITLTTVITWLFPTYWNGNNSSNYKCIGLMIVALVNWIKTEALYILMIVSIQSLILQKGPLSLSRRIGSRKKFNLFPIESYYQVLRTYIQPYQSRPDRWFRPQDPDGSRRKRRFSGALLQVPTYFRPENGSSIPAGTSPYAETGKSGKFPSSDSFRK